MNDYNFDEIGSEDDEIITDESSNVGLAEIFGDADEFAKLNETAGGTSDLSKRITLSVTEEFSESVRNFCHTHRISNVHLLAAGMALVKQATEQDLQVYGKSKRYDWSEMKSKLVNK